jgi:predicted nuclease of predicted toxin-antitoxin system
MSPEPRFLTDEDFDRDIVIGVLRRLPSFDSVRVQDVGLTRAEDPEVLEWAAANGRIIVTHDVNTMIAHSQARLLAGKALPGVLVVRQPLPIVVAIEKLLMIALCSTADEWENQIRFLPI